MSGFVSKDELIHRYESTRYPSKMTEEMYQAYFDFFKEDFNLDIHYENTIVDPNILTFNDYAVVEFWANIFRNYTDPNIGEPSLDKKGLYKLVKKNKYFDNKFWTYISYSNFEHKNHKLKLKKNLTDYEFLTTTTPSESYPSFMETYTEVGLNKINMNFLSSKIKLNLDNNNTTVAIHNVKDNELDALKSALEDRETDDDTDTDDDDDDDFNDDDKDDKDDDELDKLNQDKINEKSKKKLKKSLKYYFDIIDINKNNYITFEEFFIFIKYLRVYSGFEKYMDIRGILPKITSKSKLKFNN